jgi:hypothetical protein
LRGSQGVGRKMAGRYRNQLFRTDEWYDQA